MTTLVYKAVSSWADAIIAWNFTLDFGELARILLSQEYQQIIQNARFNYDSINVLEPCSNKEFWYQVYATHFSLANKLKEKGAVQKAKQVMKKLEARVNESSCSRVIIETCGNPDLVQIFEQMSKLFAEREKVENAFDAPTEVLPKANENVGTKTLEPSDNLELIKEVKNIASNPESVSYPQAGPVKKAFIQDIKLPIKKKDVIKLATFRAEVIPERIAINKFLDSREIANLGINEVNEEITVYRVMAGGYIGKELYSYSMVGMRVLINRKGVKLPPKVDLKAFQNEVKNVEYTVDLNSFESCARNELGADFGVVNALLLSEEFDAILKETQVQYDTNNIFSPLPEHLLYVYGIFTYRAVELIQRYWKLHESANATHKAMRRKFTGVDVDSYLEIVHEKLAKLATLDDDFELKDAIKHFKGTNGM
jgi:hypothetical protein